MEAGGEMGYTEEKSLKESLVFSIPLHLVDQFQPPSFAIPQKYEA